MLCMPCCYTVWSTWIACFCGRFSLPICSYIIYIYNMLGIFANICARGLKKRSANRRSDVPSSKIRPPSKNPGDYEAFQVFQRVRPILSLIFQNHVVFFWYEANLRKGGNEKNPVNYQWLPWITSTIKFKWNVIATSGGRSGRIFRRIQRPLDQH